MERDPLRLAWTTRPAAHCLAALSLLVAAFLLLVGIDLVRVVIDHVVLGAAPVPLLRIALTPPASLGLPALVLFKGFTLDPATFRAAVAGGLVLVPLVAAVFVAAAEALAAGIGAAVLARLRHAILDGVLSASPSARDGAQEAVTYAGDPLSRDSTILGSAVLAPLQAGGAVAATLLYLLFVDWRVAVLVAALLIFAASLAGRRLGARLDAARARRMEGAAVDQTFGDLLRRVPALRAHGTAAFERERIGAEFVAEHRPVERQERRLALADGIAASSLALTPLAALGLAAWLAGPPGLSPAGLSPGEVAAAAVAALIAAVELRVLTQWQRLIGQVRPILDETARSLGALLSRERREPAVSLPAGGPLVASGVSAYDPASGARITGVDLTIAFPAHVAVVGDGDAGPRVFALLAGGLIEPSTGRLTYGGADLAAVDPALRAGRIAFAGGDTILIPGSLQDNLLYGCPDSETDRDSRLAEAAAAAGLDRLIHARGLAGTLDPQREPKLASAIVEARRAVRAALTAEGLDRYVDPFDIGRYNHHATVGENLLFGKPIGDTFREDNLAAHPFVRAVLEAEDLTKPLAAVGVAIARSMIEIFAEIPDGSPLFERFSFFAAADRSYFEDLVERRSARRRGAELARDRERLIGLALRYGESRHRLGLVDEALQDRLVAARADFARLLPVSLRPAIEFYDEEQLCTAASLQDNLLFGRLASDQAGAEASVHAVIGRVLTERGLDAEVSRIGLSTNVDPRGGDLTLSQVAAIDLVRCLVRRPEVLVVERALDGLTGAAADGLVARLRGSLVGRGLIVVTSNLSPAMDNPPFDIVMRFERGIPALSDRRVRIGTRRCMIGLPRR